ncbi:uncharacterized protein [Haliotis cracherodii]|uniref:uncharacterized protein n=1 Tax=Haliotis cracherodii TaxID=6455 RepID=UPI0039E8E2B6
MVSSETSTRTSKACYGSPGPLCVRHDIICNINQKIAICDAYYTNNTECRQGLVTCKVNPDSVTEHGHHRFNDTELASLNNNCSKETRCSYLAPRRSAALTFSVVKYQCIEKSSAITTTNNIVSTVTRENDTRTAEDDTGAIIGGVVATVLAVLVVTLVSVALIRKRQAKREVKEKTASFPQDVQPDMTCSLAGKITQNKYNEIQDLKTQNSNYDYGKQNTEQFSTSSTTECDYDHIGDKQSPQTSDYDTTASVAQSTRTGGTIGEDNYGYNLFHEKTNPQIHQNDYDTAASASKSVAQLTRADRNTDDDDYDHFRSVTNDFVCSPYDTASGMEDNYDHSVAGQIK